MWEELCKLLLGRFPRTLAHQTSCLPLLRFQGRCINGRVCRSGWLYVSFKRSPESGTFAPDHRLNVHLTLFQFGFAQVLVVRHLAARTWLPWVTTTSAWLRIWILFACKPSSSWWRGCRPVCSVDGGPSRHFKSCPHRVTATASCAGFTCAYVIPVLFCTSCLLPRWPFGSVSFPFCFLFA